MREVAQHPELLWARPVWRRRPWWWEDQTTGQRTPDDQRPTWRLFTSTDSTGWVCRTYRAATRLGDPGGREWGRSSRRERWGRPNRPDISVEIVKLTSAMPASQPCVVPTMFSSSVLLTFIASRHFIKFSMSANQTIEHKGKRIPCFLFKLYILTSLLLLLLCVL